MSMQEDEHKLGAISVLLLTLTISLGCANEPFGHKIQSAIKDWCLVIQANQIIPVYPLMEDLRPGAVYLIELPIDAQAQLYKQRGFLPLANRLANVSSSDKLESAEKLTQVSFLTYSSTVRRKNWESFALPLQSVPIGLELIDSDEAQAAVTIEDAGTYQVDGEKLYDDVRRWTREHQDLLRRFASTPGRPRYLRVVSQVYVTKRMNVSLQSQASSGFAASVGGGAKPFNPEGTLQRLNTIVEQKLPGGIVKVVSATERTVGMIETFKTPLVFGYQGFDIQLDSDGAIGGPADSRGKLNEELLQIQNNQSKTPKEACGELPQMSSGWNYPPRIYLQNIQYVEAGDVKYVQRASPDTHPIYPYAHEIIIAPGQRFRSAAIDLDLIEPLSKQYELAWTFAGKAPVKETVRSIFCISPNRSRYTIGFVYPFDPEHPLIVTIFSTSPITVKGMKLKPFYEAINY